MANKKNVKKTSKNKIKEQDLDVEKEAQEVNEREEVVIAQRKTGLDAFDSALSVVLGGICFPIIFVLIATIIMAIFGATTQTISNSPILYSLYACSSIFGYGVYVLVFCIFKGKKNVEYNKNAVNSKQFIQAKKCNTIMVLLSVGIAILALILLNMFVQMCTDGLHGLGYSKSNNLPFQVNTIWNYLLYLVFFCALPAFCEEFLFRGIVLGGMLNQTKNHMQGVCAVLISALVFALSHQSAQQFVYPLMMGIVFGFIYYYSGNIWYSVIAHFTSNALVVTINFVKALSGTEQHATVYSWYTCIIACLLVVVFAFMAVLVFKYIRKINKEQSIFDIQNMAIRQDLVDKHLVEKKEDLVYTSNEGIICYRRSKKEKTKLAIFVGCVTIVALIAILIQDLVTYL